MLFSAVVPLAVLIALLLAMMGSLNHEYNITLKNATTASELNMNFKDTLDLNMYYVVVESKNIDHLPVEEVEQAERVLMRLQKTTTNKENVWRLSSMLNLCNRLKQCMREIEVTTGYDNRMTMLENNIYIITGLIETYMHEYIYVEVHELNQLNQQISTRVWESIAAVSIIGLSLLWLTIWYAMRVGRSITEPVAALCHKVERLGKGDFSLQPIVAKNAEVQTLDDGFHEMVGQINQLFERVKADQNALRHAEFELLQAQINPHFLYNTFDSIVWLAETHQDEQVIEMTTHLSSFFRNSLSKGKVIISMETERQQVESYLKIQQIRYHDIMTYEIMIPDDVLQYSIPKLTLQPLVENALYHGVKNKRGGGKITIKAWSDEQEIHICVQDDGAGMTPDQLQTLRAGVYENKHTGLGLINVHQRLRLYCGNRAGLLFDSQPGQGTAVTVILPKQNQLL